MKKVDISNEDKIFFPGEEITKGDVIEYYKDAADHMLPYLKDRPVMVRRFPDGIGEEGFYQKDEPGHYPGWIATVKISKKGGSLDMIVVKDLSILIYLVDQGAISFHTWLSRKDKIHHPDRFIFDLDPPGNDFSIVIDGAKAIRKIIEEEAGLTAWPMLTGSKGMHVVIPVKRENEFDELRDFAKRIAQRVSDEDKRKFTVEIRKNKRKGRLFIDYLRNSYAQTGVTPYSLRPLEGAPVAVPLQWDELDRKGLLSSYYTLKNIRKRWSEKDDPWKGMMRHAGSLDKAIERMDD